MNASVRDFLFWAAACAAPMLAVLAAARSGAAGELLVGAASTSITPDKPVALAGQFHLRVARQVETPVTATALAVERRESGKSVDHAVMVSCDLVAIRPGVQDALRRHLAAKRKGELDGLDPKKLFLSATHTHTAPVTGSTWYEVPTKGVMQPQAYVAFLVERLGEAVAAAWKARKPAGVSWALGHAVVGCNRRVVYADGSARMYGQTNTPSFRAFEGYQDHDVNVLLFWGKQKRLRAVAINLACPAQEVENRSAINADFWHDVRVQLRERHGKDLAVLAWCGAAGDISPHLLHRKAAEERMREKRGLTRTQEIARRIVRAVDDVLEIARADIRTDPPLVHKVRTLKLPRRKVTQGELDEAKARLASLQRRRKPGRGQAAQLARCQDVIARWDAQKADPNYAMELHVIRLGDVAIATNPFELYLDYGLQMKARSRAVQTFIVQLACDSGKYLPTPKAIRGGHYSSRIEDNYVGPEGGQMLVNETVKTIGALWAK